MDKVYKLPKIAFPEVTGSTVSFYSEYAGLPLKKCEVAFTATQSGTGDPSPDNVRPIVGVDEITQTVNGVETVIDLDGTRYGGTYNSVTGKMLVTWTAVDLSSCVWVKQTPTVGARWRTTDIKNYKNQSLYHVPTNVILEQFKLSSYSGSSVIDNIGYLRITNGNIYAVTDNENIKPSGLIVYELEMPIEVQLTPAQIETIAGTNTIFADTGDTTVQYIRVY